MKRIEDYKQEVILAYKKRKDEGTLPHNLQNHTAANLRKECLTVFHKRYSEKDAETFKLLLSEERNSAEEYFKKIKTTSADKFKPLDNFLKGNTTDTKVKNIELLAWLIDFQPRPHVYADIYELIQNESEEDKIIDADEITKEEFSEQVPALSVDSLLDTDKSADIDEKIEAEFSEFIPERPINGLLGNSPSGNSPLDKNPKSSNGKFGFPRKFNKAVLSFVAAFLIVGGSYFFYDMSNQCMYWNGDEYQSVNCNQKVEGANIIPKDAFRLKHLKRIKNISEITRDDIGKVHYSKINGNVEFYTTGGENPTDSRKRLLPLSEHMYVEHVEGNQP